MSSSYPPRLGYHARCEGHRDSDAALACAHEKLTTALRANELQAVELSMMRDLLGRKQDEIARLRGVETTLAAKVEEYEGVIRAYRDHEIKQLAKVKKFDEENVKLRRELVERTMRDAERIGKLEEANEGLRRDARAYAQAHEADRAEVRDLEARLERVSRFVVNRIGPSETSRRVFERWYDPEGSREGSREPRVPGCR